MTLGAPWGHDSKTYAGKEMRELVEAMFATPGAVGVSDFLVEQQSSPGPTVKVRAGQLVVNATGSGLFGKYQVPNDASINSGSFTATSGNGRWDYLILRVTAGVAALEIVQGTAAASPAAPTITGDNYEPLALIKLPPSTTNITTAMINDARRLATSTGGVVPVATAADLATLLPSPRIGQQAHILASGGMVFWNGTIWQRFGAPYGRRIRTGGNVGLSATGNWTDFSGAWDGAAAQDISLPAATGDIIEVAVSGRWVGDSGLGMLDIKCVASGNYFGSATDPSTNNGVPAWISTDLAIYHGIGGSAFRTLVSGDISGGVVALRPRTRCTGATRSLFATTTDPFVVVARNLGPVMAG